MRRAVLVAFPFLLILGAEAGAVVVVDADVEDDGDWTTSGVVWTSDTTFITPGFQEGSEGADLDDLPSAPNTISQTFPGTLQPGTYTVEFAVGAASSGMFPIGATDFEFSGMGGAEAFSLDIPEPASGTWELWTVVWKVGPCDPRVGDPLSWLFQVGEHPGARPARFDGVGSLSSSGNGFVVTYDPAVDGDYALFGETRVHYPGSPVLIESIAGASIIEDDGTGSPTLEKFDIEVCWSETFDATPFTGTPGSTVFMDSIQKITPAVPHVGTGGFANGDIDWGTLSGWTQTGRLVCQTTCPGGCGGTSACVPFFGFEGTGPPIPLTTIDTGTWGFLIIHGDGAAFGMGRFDISDIEPGPPGLQFLQELHVVGVRARAVQFSPGAYCVMGGSTGVDWSWQLSDQSSTWSDLNVTNTATTSADLADLLVASINAQAAPTITATGSSLATSCFSLSGGDPDYTLEVGAAGMAPDCTVDNRDGCIFNPIIIPQPMYVPVPAAPAWALGATGLTLAALGYRLLRRRRLRRS